MPYPASAGLRSQEQLKTPASAVRTLRTETIYVQVGTNCQVQRFPSSYRDLSFPGRFRPPSRMLLVSLNFIIHNASLTGLYSAGVLFFFYLFKYFVLGNNILLYQQPGQWMI